MRTLFLAVTTALIFAAPPPVAAAPKAQHAAECSWYWDIAITARASAMEGVALDATRRIVWRIFSTKIERMREIADLVVDAAHATPWAPEERPGELAKKIADACGENGDMDRYLGTRL